MLKNNPIHGRSLLLALAAALLILAVPLLAHASNNGLNLRPRAMFDSVFGTIQNSYIKTNVDDEGQFVTGTTGGDPTLPGDNDKRLLFGYPDDIWTSFSSVRIVTDTASVDYRLEDEPPAAGPTVVGDEVTTSWTTDSVKIEQLLSLASNPFTGREDTTKIVYTVTNNNNTVYTVGVRCMLDVRIGDNDGAPYFIPGVGTVTNETEFLAPNTPAYWKAFESATFAADSLKGQGLMEGSGATPPDRFVVVQWPGIYGSVWDYSVTSSLPVTGDSAVALYWNPVPLPPGESATFVTYYGLGGPGGGSTFIEGPVAVTCDELQFGADLFVVNTTGTDFQGGSSTINLPSGLELAPGESPTKSMSDVPPGEARSVSWQIVADGTVDGALSYSATTTFTEGPEPLTADATVEVPQCGETPVGGVTLGGQPLRAALLWAALASLTGLVLGGSIFALKRRAG